MASIRGLPRRATSIHARRLDTQPRRRRALRPAAIAAALLLSMPLLVGLAPSAAASRDCAELPNNNAELCVDVSGDSDSCPGMAAEAYYNPSGELLVGFCFWGNLTPAICVTDTTRLPDTDAVLCTGDLWPCLVMRIEYEYDYWSEYGWYTYTCLREGPLPTILDEAWAAVGTLQGIVGPIVDQALEPVRPVLDEALTAANYLANYAIKEAARLPDQLLFIADCSLYNPILSCVGDGQRDRTASATCPGTGTSPSCVILIHTRVELDDCNAWRTYCPRATHRCEGTAIVANPDAVNRTVSFDCFSAYWWDSYWQETRDQKTCSPLVGVSGLYACTFAHERVQWTVPCPEFGAEVVAGSPPAGARAAVAPIIACSDGFH